MSVVARVHNNLVTAMAEQPRLLKSIIFILDGDLIKSVFHENLGISEIFGQLLKNLMVGIHSVILTHKENLPKRAKHLGYPTILWLVLPQHMAFPGSWNMHCKKFMICINRVVQLFEEMTTLRMLKIWDYNDTAFFSDRQYMAKGLAAYWASVDSAFRHWDTFVWVKQSRKIQQNLQDKSKQGQVPQKRPGDFIARELKKYKRFKRNDWQGKDMEESRPQHFQDY